MLERFLLISLDFFISFIDYLLELQLDKSKEHFTLLQKGNQMFMMCNILLCLELGYNHQCLVFGCNDLVGTNFL